LENKGVNKMIVQIIKPYNKIGLSYIRIYCKNILILEFPVKTLAQAEKIKEAIEEGYHDATEIRPLNEILKEGE
jgi:hypothetical protein